MCKTIEEICNYKPRLDLLDPFGMGRLRELSYDCKIVFSRIREEMAIKDEVIANQAKAITAMTGAVLEPSVNAQKRIEYLEKALKRAEEDRDAAVWLAEKFERDLAIANKKSMQE